MKYAGITSVFAPLNIVAELFVVPPGNPVLTANALTLRPVMITRNVTACVKIARVSANSYRDCAHYCTFLWGRTDLGTCSNGDHLGTDSDMGGYIYSTVGLNYYNAIDFCAKYNKKLLTPEELGCQNRADGQGWICNLSNLPKGTFWTKTWFSNDIPFAIDTKSQQIKTDYGWSCNRNALCR